MSAYQIYEENGQTETWETLCWRMQQKFVPSGGLLTSRAGWQVPFGSLLISRFFALFGTLMMCKFRLWRVWNGRWGIMSDHISMIVKIMTQFCINVYFWSFWPDFGPHKLFNLRQTRDAPPGFYRLQFPLNTEFIIEKADVHGLIQYFLELCMLQSKHIRAISIQAVCPLHLTVEVSSQIRNACTTAKGIPFPNGTLFFQ